MVWTEPPGRCHLQAPVHLRCTQSYIQWYTVFCPWHPSVLTQGWGYSSPPTGTKAWPSSIIPQGGNERTEARDTNYIEIPSTTPLDDWQRARSSSLLLPSPQSQKQPAHTMVYACARVGSLCGPQFFSHFPAPLSISCRVLSLALATPARHTPDVLCHIASTQNHQTSKGKKVESSFNHVIYITWSKSYI